MMRYFYAWIVLVCCCFHVFAQPFNNEWIDPSLRYFRIKVAENGIYRVTQEELKAAGFPVDLINPRNLKLYFRGIEQAIHVEGESDGFFDRGDYIEFFGRKNDGFVDGQMIADDGGFQTTPYFNMYSDATYYFLTASIDGTRGKRMSISTITSTTPTTVHYEQITPSVHIRYSNNYIELAQGPYFQCYPNIGCGPADSRWTAAKGPRGPFVWSQPNQNVGVVALQASRLHREGEIQLELRFIGDFVGLERINHNIERTVEIAAGRSRTQQRSLTSVTIGSFQGKVVNVTLLPSDFASNDSVYITYRVQSFFNLAAVALTSLKMTFPQTIHLPANQNSKRFYFPEGESLFFELTSSEPIFAYDLSDEHSPKILKVTTLQNRHQIHLEANDKKRSVLCTKEIRKVLSIQPSGIFPLQKEYDLIMIAHPWLMNPASGYSNPCQAYADYRSSTEGGGHKVLLLSILDVYDMFSFGEKNPYAIRQLAKYFKKNGRLDHIFLIGKGLAVNIQYDRQPDASSWSFHDFIPTYGYPSSDYGFVTGLTNSKSNRVEVSIGRLSCQSPQEVANYFNKVKEFEAQSHQQLWRKELMHLSGGLSYPEFTRFRSYITTMRNIAAGKYLGAKVVMGFKNTNNEIGELEMSTEVNNGKMLITFYGHSSTFLTDINIGYVSDPKNRYANKGRYPLIFFNGCDIGNTFNLIETVGEDWMTEPNRGAIAILAQSHIGFESALVGYANRFYESYFTKLSNINLPIGKVMQNFLNDYIGLSPNNPYFVANLQQYTLQADPAIVLFKPNKPDYGFINDQVTIQNGTPNLPLSTESDSFKITLPIANYGI
ncbi:MAG: C25 family cysteine peptidase, partial [Flammeovirgaceae bacterium]|nr:C25 family cysteine peptidase [Flammeovirgaceae bacterium]MDW8287215.1 C25 family cysteine peptidase [Flammeovirgaceae bacterium]